MSSQEGEEGVLMSEYQKNQSLVDPKINSFTNNNLHSWRPPTPPPTDSETSQEAKRSWNVRNALNPENIRQIPDQKAENENRSRLSVSRQNSDVFMDESLDSLLLTEDAAEQCDLGRSENIEDRSLFHDKKQFQSSENTSTTYNLLKSHSLSLDQGQNDVSFFYSGMDDLEFQRPSVPNWIRARNLQQQNTEYFDHALRREFVEAHSLLNAVIMGKKKRDNEEPLDPDEDIEDDYIDFSTLFSFKCSPTSRHRDHMRIEKNLPAIADIRKSSLSYFHKGRVQMRLPTDNIRLAMDESLEPGILIVEKSQKPVCVHGHITEHGEGPPLKNDERSKKCHDTEKNVSTMRLNGHQTPTALFFKSEDADDVEEQELEPLKYILTVDQNIYKRLLADISSSRMPCGLYYCCHDAVDHSKNVNIGMAVAILSVVFILMFSATCVWPLD